jgi:23S rRNA (adenine2030-N6)-methyltransferase
MNYRHAYHAGNFADVFKHAVLARIIVHLQKKDAAFRFLDIHAGRGAYDLSAPEAQKTGEWRNGIGRLIAAKLPATVKDLVAPYLDSIAATSQAPLVAGRAPALYPGSPAIMHYLARRNDRLTLTELHPQDYAALAKRYAGDIKVKVIELDGWLALKGFLPPKERRGLVLIDPPFEERDEFERVVAGIVDAQKRFATGVQMIWYPIKDPREARRFRDAVKATGIRRILSAELAVRQPVPDGTLSANGLLVINPPWMLDEEIRVMAPVLAEVMAIGAGAGSAVDWLVAE